MYAAQRLYGLAQTLLLQDWIAVWMGLLAILLPAVVRAPQEERVMREHRGAAYRAYHARTGGILPRLRRQRSAGSNPD